MTATEIIKQERLRAERDGVIVSQMPVSRDTFLAGYLSACAILEQKVIDDDQYDPAEPYGGA